MRGLGVRGVTVLSGFLGSGKTSLLRRWLTSPDAAGTVVIVNELGEVGLDQHQFRHVAERTVLLANGCVCCATRADLAEALREIVALEESGRTPRARRVAVETSGLADPGSIVATLGRDRLLAHRFAVERVVVTCDAEHAAEHAGLPEWQAQIAAADLIALTKLDRVDASARRRAEGLAGSRNPAAEMHDAAGLESWLGLRSSRSAMRPATACPDQHDHATDVVTASITVGRPVDPAVVSVWLGALLHAHGRELLRVKALLDTGEGAGPLVLDAVGHTAYPPWHLDSWPGRRRRSSLVAITRSFDASRITASFARAAGQRRDGQASSRADDVGRAGGNLGPAVGGDRGAHGSGSRDR